MADNLATVHGIYDAFGRGDVEWIMQQIDPACAWEHGTRDTGLVYMRPRTGTDEVGAFFADLMGAVQLEHFEPWAFCEGGDVVIVAVRHAGRVIGGGEVPMTEEAHVWQFGPDGKVIGFRHLLDLAIHEAAAALRNAPLTGRTLRAVGDTIEVKRAGGRFELFEVEGPRDSGPPPHSHPWDEGYIGISGEVEVVIGDEVSVLRPGDVLTSLAGVTHCYRILSDTARFTVITSGHRASAFFADLDANAEPGMPTPDTLLGIIEVAKRNGLSSPLFA